ncbi:MAG: plastocyanin/azurin family copper-binding protein, partial [Nitrososphaeraceae archaeon]
TNGDSTLHTVTSGSAESGNSGNEFDSSYLAAGKTFQHQFGTAGTFDYYCTLHPWMKGKVVVSQLLFFFLHFNYNSLPESEANRHSSVRYA